MKYYAVRVGKIPGIYETWEACKAQIHRYPGAEYKSFSTHKKAESWIRKQDADEEKYYDRRSPSKRVGEVKVTDQEKVSSPSDDDDSSSDDDSSDDDSSSSSDDDSSSSSDEEEDEDIIHVFTDGACSNNGKHNARAGLGVYFGEGDPRNFSGAVFGKQTNNTAEIKAIIKAYDILEKEIRDDDRVNIYTDSRYAMLVVGDYGKRQNDANWKNDIPNKQLVKKLYNLFKDRDNVKFIHVKAHTGEEDWISLGNEEADRYAREGLVSKK